MALHHSSRFFVLILSCLAAFGIFSTSIYLPSMPAIGDALNASQASVQLTLTYFFLGSSLGQLFLGPVSDRYGRLPVVYFGLGLFIISSLWCAIASDIYSLQMARLFQGIAASAGPLISRAVARDLMSGPDLTRTMSTIMMTISISPAIAPLLGGFLQGHFGWQANFYALMVFGAAVGLLVWFLLPETLIQESAPSVKSTFRSYGTLLKHRAFMANSLVLAGTFGSIFCFITMSPYIFVKEFGWSPQQYPMVSIMMAAGNIIGFSFTRHLAFRLKPNTTILMGLAILLIINALLVLMIASGAVTPWVMLGYAGFLMIGGAFITANASSAALTLFPHKAGVASALIGAIQIGAGAFSSAIAGLVEDTPLGVAIAVLIFIVSSFIAWFILIFTGKNKVSEDHLAH